MFGWLGKFLEDNPSKEEKAFWSFFEQNMVRGTCFVSFAKLLKEFELEELCKLSKKLARKGLIHVGRHGLYATRKGEAVLKRLHPSNSLPNTISGRTTEQLPAERITKRLSDGGRITKRLPENGRNTKKIN
ncbi:MAG: hypothetical protein ACK5O9_05175 [Holosporales bacterium]